MSLSEQNGHHRSPLEHELKATFQPFRLSQGPRQRHLRLLAQRATTGHESSFSDRWVELGLLITALLIVIGFGTWQIIHTNVATPDSPTTSAEATAIPDEIVQLADEHDDSPGRSRRIRNIAIPNRTSRASVISTLAEEAQRFLQESEADVVAVRAWSAASAYPDDHWDIGTVYVSRDGLGWAGSGNRTRGRFPNDSGMIRIELRMWPSQTPGSVGLTGVLYLPKS